MAYDSYHNSWQSLVSLLRSPENGLKCVFPANQRRVSVLEALSSEEVAASPDAAEQGRRLGQGLHQLLHQLEIFDAVSRCPILAVTGLLNAGKSSLLATYLSHENQKRVLRGTGNSSGTHRFVLWLPKLWWEDANLLATLISFLSEVFGHAPETLSEDPAEAALQYNGRVNVAALMRHPGGQTSSLGSSRPLDPLRVPLVAYDEKLDELKIGLIDCPDIQTGYFDAAGGTTGAQLAASRQQQLSHISRLCSAFIVVARMNSLHDDDLLRILATLRDAMPGVPRFLAINRIKSRYAPETVFAEARGLVDRFGIDAVYGAYNFRSALAESRIPPKPAKMSTEDSQLPIFFELSPASTTRLPRVLSQSQVPRSQSGESHLSGPQFSETKPSLPSSPSPSLVYLFNLGDRLDAGTLAKASSRSLVNQLVAKTSQAIEWMQRNQIARDQQIADAWQAVADACHDFMVERDANGYPVGLRLQASPTIVAQMADSLQRTAPFWMKASLSIDRTARQLHQAVGNAASRLKILQSASQSVTQLTKRFRRGDGASVVTPQRLAEAISSHDIDNSLHRLTSEQMVAGCQSAMLRFAAEDSSRLDETQLDAWSREIWANMKWKEKLWKGTQPLAVITAPLLAVVLVPFDGGGTAVLVFASAKELLAAAGLATLLGPMGTGGETLSIIHNEIPWRQLSDLYAIVCDSLGLPRPIRPNDQGAASGETGWLSSFADQMPSVKVVGHSKRALLISKVAVKQTTLPPAVHRWELDPDRLRAITLELQKQV